MALTQKMGSSLALTLVIVILNVAIVPGQVIGGEQIFGSGDILDMLLSIGKSTAADDIKVSAPVTVATDGMPEATVAVIQPNKYQRCLDGRVLFGSGTIVRSISLTPVSGHAPFSHNFYPDITSKLDPTPPYTIYDNHLVASGDFLMYTFEGVIWSDNIQPYPSWWNDTRINTLKYKNVPGGRSAIFVFTSNTCGETWTQQTTIDAAKLQVRNPVTKQMEVGYCGAPRIDSVNRTADPGGWDGHYVYQDFMPAGFTLITTICATGKGPWVGLLLSKPGAGYDWKVLRQYDNPDGFWRVPAAMLSNQTVGIVYKQGGSLILEAARFPFTMGDFKTIATFPISYPSLGQDNIGLNAFMYGYFGLINTMRLDKTTFKSQEGFQVAAPMNDRNDAAYNLYFQTPEINTGTPQPFSTIRAATKGHSPLQGTLVRNTSPGLSSIFYWIEELSKGQFQIRFQLYNQNVPVGTPRTISSTFSTPGFTGDYLSGTSYFANDGTHYFLSWSESNTLKYVEVFAPRSVSPW